MRRTASARTHPERRLASLWHGSVRFGDGGRTRTKTPSASMRVAALAGGIVSALLLAAFAAADAQGGAVTASSPHAQASPAAKQKPRARCARVRRAAKRRAARCARRVKVQPARPVAPQPQPQPAAPATQPQPAPPVAQPLGTFVTKEAEMVKPFGWFAPNPCTGELVAVQGHNHVKLQLMVDGNGGIHAMSVTWNAHGSGLSALGNRYQVSQQEYNHFNFPEPTFTFSMQKRLKVYRVGELPLIPDDFYLYEHIHVTSNANGAVSAFFVKDNLPEGRCK